MRHTAVRRTVVVLAAVLVSVAWLFVWRVSPRQVEAPPAAPSSAAEPSPSAVDLPLPASSRLPLSARPASPWSVSSELPSGPTPTGVEPRPTGGAIPARPVPQRRAAPTHPSLPPDGAALFRVYCGSCHSTSSLKLAQPRVDLEIFLRTHGSASDADDVVILDFLEGRR